MRKFSQSLVVRRILLSALVTVGAATFLSISALAAVAPQVYIFDDSNSELKALAIGRPKVLKINTEGVGPVGQLQLLNGKLTGTLKVSTASLSTGVSLRDRHLKEKYIDVEKYPEAILTFNELLLSQADLLKGVKGRSFKGELLFHGEKKPVTGEFSAEQSNGNVLNVQAQFKFKLTDFKVDIPSYLGIVIADELTVEVKAKPILQKSKL